MKRERELKREVRAFVLGALLMALIPTSVVFANSQLVEIFFNVNAVTLDGQTIELGDDEQPFILEGRTFLPVAAVARALGLTVSWDGATQTVHLEGGGQTAQPAQPAGATSLVDTLFNATGFPAEVHPNGHNEFTITTLRPGNIVYRHHPQTANSRQAMSQHDLGGNYSTLTTQIAHVAGSRLSDVTFTFIGDGETLATFSRTQHQPLPYNIVVDVSGVSVLRIDAVSEAGSFGPAVAHHSHNPIGSENVSGWELIEPTLTP